MAELKEISQLFWEQLHPNPGDEVKVTREQILATAKIEHAYHLWVKLKQDKREYGDCDIPSYLLTEVELDVKDKVIDMSELKVMKGIDLEMWLQDVRGGEDNCSCHYVKTTLNKWKALCDDDSLADTDKVYYPQGKKLKFPLGTHSDKLTIVYAHNGENTEDDVEVDDMIGALVRRSLMEIYLGKIGPEDKSNDSNSNNP